MNAGAQNGTADEAPFGIEQEVDLLEYLNAILRAKYRILVIALIGAGGVFGLAQLVDDVFLSVAVVAINIDENAGGVSPKNYRSGDTLGLLEYDFIIDEVPDNERDRLMARMRSARFSEIFIKENELLPVIFHKHWDAQKKSWIGDFQPEMRAAVSTFQNGMRGLEYDEKSGLLLIRFKTRDPQLSARLANRFVTRFNEFIREREVADLRSRREFLEKRLTETQNLELHRSIFRMLEVQLAAEMLLYAREWYPLEEIQPALPPLHKASPSRKKWAAMAFIGFTFLGVMVVVGRVILGKLRAGLARYRNPVANAAAMTTGESAPPEYAAPACPSSSDGPLVEYESLGDAQKT